MELWFSFLVRPILENWKWSTENILIEINITQSWGGKRAAYKGEPHISTALKL